MSTPVSTTPISVNYTARDYYALREELIERVKDRVNIDSSQPQWTGEDPADFGIALIEAFSYLGDLISYYIDRAANETIISTATQRKSILAIAQTFGYYPVGYRQATTLVEFSNTSEDDITIPAGTVVSGSVTSGENTYQVSFTMDADTFVPAISGVIAGTGQGTASEGRSVGLIAASANEYGELVGVSDGSPSMEFELGEFPVVASSISVYVQEGDVYSKWTKVQHLLDYSPTSLVYETYMDASGSTFIKFGNGVSGKIPTAFSEIRVMYMVGGGSTGNINAGTLESIDFIPGLTDLQVAAIQAAITLNNIEDAVGGDDPETDAQIRYAAPLTLRALNRAVTLQDYESLALAVSGIGKASASATVWTDVNLYIAPTRSANGTDLFAPGYETDGVTPSAEYIALEEALTTYLQDKTLIGATVTINPPTYVDADLAIQYKHLPQYTSTEVEANIKRTLLSSLGYVNQSFGGTIYPQNIEFILQTIAGVESATVQYMHRHGDPAARNTLTGAADEIFRFTQANLTVTLVP